ncbi:hypothetical protein HII31_00672 [Pseudocercospora fuligena]|uniref:Nudix hydrolase domain-containing protein n=1 Tax=Pseudocercospora fuligena TaxID=685502 RepID=A0A8H6RV62_9PEZI|nr:hypothetical protein HII31_00672 [Pseudocercospora fuligena]
MTDSGDATAMPPTSVIPHLQRILNDLTNSPYPVLPSPESQKRRASVALVIRVQPSYAHWPESAAPQSPAQKANSIDSFFSQEWVQHGEPEVLFIKRASRKGDRWTSHIALPGGKRDPEDADDQAAAVREALEEVGLDLAEYAIPCGNLPQRMVTTHWGKKPLMVLCPYVFLVTTHGHPKLRLQPTEVAETHWVPLRSLLDPANRTVAFEDVSSRMANEETGVKKWMLSVILGKMSFAAISLEPTDSLYSIETPVDFNHASLTMCDKVCSTVTKIAKSDIFNQLRLPGKYCALLLWGLTLGVVSDFLDLVPPHNALTLWTYPTFTPLDVRFAIWLMTYNFKERKRIELQSGTEFSFRGMRPSFGGASESGIISKVQPIADVSESTVFVEGPEENERVDETGLHGLGTGMGVGKVASRKSAVATMLEGYYDIVRRAVAVSLAGRAGVAVVLGVLLYKKYWKK